MKYTFKKREEVLEVKCFTEPSMIYLIKNQGYYTKFGFFSEAPHTQRYKEFFYFHIKISITL